MTDMNRVPWRISECTKYGAVVCDVPCRPRDVWDDVYGGFLVCEGVFSPETRRLIAASPEMRSLLFRVMAEKCCPEETVLGRAIMEILDRTEIENGNSDRRSTSDPVSQPACSDGRNCPF